MSPAAGTAESRPPFKVKGVATIKHLNVRKQGPEDEKVLAVDVKMEIKQVDRRLCAYFDEALEPFLWRGDTDAMIVRNIWLSPVIYGHEITGATVTIGNETFLGCDVKKFTLEPRDGGVMNLTLAVSLFPSSNEVSDLAKLVQEDAHVEIEGPPDLFAGSDVGPDDFGLGSIPDLDSFEVGGGESIDLLDDARQLVLTTRKASISLVQRHLRIGYNQAARLIEALEKEGIVSLMKPNGTRVVIGGAA